MLPALLKYFYSFLRKLLILRKASCLVYPIFSIICNKRFRDGASAEDFVCHSALAFIALVGCESRDLIQLDDGGSQGLLPIAKLVSDRKG